LACSAGSVSAETEYGVEAWGTLKQNRLDASVFSVKLMPLPEMIHEH
jgi:hypothetical protein